MADCSKIQSMIEPFLRDTLIPAEKETFLKHVQTCKTCRHELEEENIIYYVLSQLGLGNYAEDTDYEAALEQKLAQIEDDALRRKMIRHTIEIALGIGIAIVLYLLLN